MALFSQFTLFETHRSVTNFRVLKLYEKDVLVKFEDVFDNQKQTSFGFSCLYANILRIEYFDVSWIQGFKQIP